MTPELGWLGLVAAIVKRTPRLDGALCAGRPEVFDCRDGVGVETAVALCRRCPSLANCRDWSARERELAGVVAGRYRNRKRRFDCEDTGPNHPIAHGDKVKQ